MIRIDEQAAFLIDFCKLVQYCTETLGWKVTAGELWRPVEMQRIYVQTGRSKTMESKHLIRLAGDLNFFIAGTFVCTVEDIKPAGDYWESLNPKNFWGGNFNTFKDVPHFERRP